MSTATQPASLAELHERRAGIEQRLDAIGAELEAAQDALGEAIADGADPAEARAKVRELTDERDGLNRAVAALARKIVAAEARERAAAREAAREREAAARAALLDAMTAFTRWSTPWLAEVPAHAAAIEAAQLDYKQAIDARLHAEGVTGYAATDALAGAYSIVPPALAARLRSLILAAENQAVPEHPFPSTQPAPSGKHAELMDRLAQRGATFVPGPLVAPGATPRRVKGAGPIVAPGAEERRIPGPGAEPLVAPAALDALAAKDAGAEGEDDAPELPELE